MVSLNFVIIFNQNSKTSNFYFQFYFVDVFIIIFTQVFHSESQSYQDYDKHYCHSLTADTFSEAFDNYFCQGIIFIIFLIFQREVAAELASEQAATANHQS